MDIKIANLNAWAAELLATKDKGSIWAEARATAERVLVDAGPYDIVLAAEHDGLHFIIALCLRADERFVVRMSFAAAHWAHWQVVPDRGYWHRGGDGAWGFVSTPILLPPDEPTQLSLF